jgi:periplasmic protein CpxP/Spy
MRKYLALAAVAALFVSSGALAQQPAPLPSPRLESGASSFTEAQVKSRLEAAGYTNVTELRKDEQGIWRGKAMKDGRQVNVGVDFKGNIAIT